METCSIPGCEGKRRGRGLCGAHYERERRAGKIPARRDRSACAVPDCQSLVVGAGYCDVHYRRFRRNGSPERQDRSAETRFWSYVKKRSPRSCWDWIGSGWPEGYGALRIGDQKVPAHRFSYELHKGPIADGLVIDHLCRNRACVNPDHLEAVTVRENVRRGNGMGGRYSRRDACLRGHSYVETGYIRPKGDRGCRVCDKIRYERSRVK